MQFSDYQLDSCFLSAQVTIIKFTVLLKKELKM